MTEERENVTAEPDKLHESIGINARPIIGWTCALCGLVVASLLLMWWLLNSYTNGPSDAAGTDETPRSATITRALPPLDPAQAKELEQLLQRQQTWLNEYARHDQRPSFARIPLEAAADMLAGSDLRYEPPKSSDDSAESTNETNADANPTN